MLWATRLLDILVMVKIFSLILSNAEQSIGNRNDPLNPNKLGLSVFIPLCLNRNLFIYLDWHIK
jgi:hypothetical protein